MMEIMEYTISQTQTHVMHQIAKVTFFRYGITML
jgi:hypothetical protein